MKALGREEKGEVVSLLGYHLECLGPDEFFKYVAQVGDVAFIDTRVLFAHGGRQIDPLDRYRSDLGWFSEVGDPFVRDFTRAAVNAGIPVVMGGHSLVSGGIWLLVERLVARG